jgi:hypothetical protein
LLRLILENEVSIYPSTIIAVQASLVLIPILWPSSIIIGTSPNPIITFPHSAFPPIHIIVDKFKDLLILVIAACTGMSNLALVFIHDKETRIASCSIVDDVRATYSMLVRLLRNVIVIFGGTL